MRGVMSITNNEKKNHITRSHCTHLRQVVAPGQEQHLRDVLLPVTSVEAHQHVAQHEVEAKRRYAVVQPPKHRPQHPGDEEGRPSV